MGKSKPKAVDTSGMEQATREATQLQRDIYNQNVELAQPFYDTGVSAMGRLSDLLGISGGSMRSRDQIYQDLLPQYTTQQNVGGGLVRLGGSVMPLEDLLNTSIDSAALGLSTTGRNSGAGARSSVIANINSGMDVNEALKGYGGQLLSPSQQEVVDYEALNAAVEDALAGQELPSDYGALTERFSLDKFEEDPGYQYRQQEAQKALERAMAAQGVTLGGGGFGNINPQVAKALQEQSQGMASQEYGNAYNRYVNDQLNQYNMLAGLGGYGQVGLGSLSGSGNQMATNVGNLTTGLASAQMNANLAAQAQPSMFEQLLPVAGQVASAYLLSDINLKENIKYVGDERGHRVYEFSYKGKPERYVGVMAQEVQEIMPEAVVVMPSGYLGVNYDMIGLEMRQV